MGLSAGQAPLVANDIVTVVTDGVGILSNTTIGTLGSDTNGVTIVTAGNKGRRVNTLQASTDDTTAIDVFLYIKRGSLIIPLGMFRIPASAGNLNGIPAIDVLDGINILGLPIDQNGKRFINLNANDVLKATTKANLNTGKYGYLSSNFSPNYQA